MLLALVVGGAQAVGRPVLLVAMTGWGQPSDQARTAAAGFDHHLVKPAELEVIERLLADARGGSMAP